MKAGVSVSNSKAATRTITYAKCGHQEQMEGTGAKTKRQWCVVCRPAAEQRRRDKLSKRNREDLSLRAKSAKRMRKNNPMRDKDVSARNHAAAKRSRQEGAWAQPVGPAHHRWRGNRRFNLACRTRLYGAWTLPVMERDGFCCCRCGNRGDRGTLHVHHVRPLREIIESVLDERGVSQPDTLPDDSRSQLIDAVVAEHELSDGTTLCPECHEKLDDCYKAVTGRRG